MRMTRVGYGMVGVGVAVIAGWAGVAFACSPLPQVYSALPESAAPGDTVVVRGEAVRSGSPVEIRWNGVKGNVLAVVTPDSGGAFSVPVVVPAAAPGIYSLTVATADAGANRTAFEVTAPAGSSEVAVPVELWPSLASRPSMTESAPAGPSAAGLAVLGVGLVGLAGGSTLALARRRRVLSGAQQ